MLVQELKLIKNYYLLTMKVYKMGEYHRYLGDQIRLQTNIVLTMVLTKPVAF